MTTTLDEIRAAALQLTDEERLELADSLWESVDMEDGPRFSTDGMTAEEFHEELNRRSLDAREHPELLLTWEQVREME
jgi:putative addiction module component (TIGR02574 family)